MVTAITMDDSKAIKWYIDAAFGAHKDLKSQTGAIMLLGEGALSSVSTKQKVNLRSSTEAELLSMISSVRYSGQNYFWKIKV